MDLNMAANLKASTESKETEKRTFRPEKASHMVSIDSNDEKTSFANIIPVENNFTRGALFPAPSQCSAREMTG